MYYMSKILDLSPEFYRKDGCFPMKSTKHWLKAISLSLALVALSIFVTGCGTFDATDGEKTADAMLEVMNQVQSVETSITLDIQGRFTNGDDTDSDSHTAAVNSTATIESSYSPLACHSQFYSSILVDGAVSREERECYIVPDGSDYIRYDYVPTSSEWTQSKVLRPDALSTPRKTGLIYDWKDFMHGLTYQESASSDSEKQYVIYSGQVNKSVLQELLGNNVFGSFTYSMEWLLDDAIPCTFYIDSKTALPDHFVLDFVDSFLSSNMTFSVAELTVNYGEWNNLKAISAPKRVTVVSSNPDAEFYANYSAWNLFLPYVGGQIDNTSGTAGNAGQSFSATWDSFQVRIDGGMTNIPLSYADLEKVGYTVDENYSNLIIEPNMYKEDVVLLKGSDKLTVWLYNDDTVAQPVTNCKVCAIDYIASQLRNNGIKIFLPGEVTLGVSKDALLSAYGDPSVEKTAFSCDTYIWNGKSESQSLLAEISPVTGQVIRLRVCNIPVTGGAQK